MGLKKFKQARDCVLIGLNQMPNDKDLQTQLSKIDNELKVADASPSTSASQSKKSASVKDSAPNTTTASAPVEESHEDLQDTIVRGYKKLDDGRVTTFFNNTLDEQVYFRDTFYFKI